MSHSPSYVTFHIGPIFCSSGIMYSTNLSGSWNVQEIGFHFHNMENTSLSKKKKKKREQKCLESHNHAVILLSDMACSNSIILLTL